MKNGCLIVCATIIVVIFLIIGLVFLFPEKPASEEKIKEILTAEYHKVKDSEELNKKIEALKFLEKKKTKILDLLPINNQNEIYLDLNIDSKLTLKLPEQLLNELSVYKSQHSFSEQLKITKDERFILINTVTDYKNYLFIDHSLYFVDTLPSNHNNKKFIKIINIGDHLKYTITIRDAFSYIDPNNFSPN